MKNKQGYYEIENIDDPCYVALAVYPKEYFEIFKKGKCIKKASRNTEFKNFAR